MLYLPKVEGLQKHPRGTARAFTLVELLVVVAILGILAAVAVPNFLEAQVRTKVARVKNDLRTLATGLESYLVDHNGLPQANSFFDPMPSRRLKALTTPVAYLTAIPSDPIERTSAGNFDSSLRSIDPDEPLNIYLYNQASTQFGSSATSEVADRKSYSLTSGGPDLTIAFPYYAFADTFIQSRSYAQYIYDPTNGTVSPGEIFRRGGAARANVLGLDTW